MEVLSCSEALYAGESNGSQKSPGTKPSDGIIEEVPALQQVGCPRERTTKELSLGVLERKQFVLEVDYSKQTPDDDKSNDSNEGDDTPLEFNCTLQRPRDELLNGIHTADEPLQKVDCSHQWRGDELLSKPHEGKTRILRIDSPHMEGCNLSNGSCEEAVENYKEKADHFRSVELLPCSDFLLRKECKVEQVLKELCKENDYVLNAEAQNDEINEDKERDDILSTSESILGRTSDSQLPSDFHDLSNKVHKVNISERGNLSMQDECKEPFSASNNSNTTIENLEGKLQNINQEGEFGHLEAMSPEQNGTVALWVKWRGKWQTGIRCSRADCPLPTLRAKPTHERKKYFVVFFPHTRTYSWADMLLVRSIDELPEPLAYGTHYSWMGLVKDLTIPRRYIMQKLAVSMLNISDQLHTEAVIESARKAVSWKEFAMEASRCRGYPALGRMLLKLQKMILPGYISPHWLEHSFDSWVQRCQNAQSAESVEILTEELVDSVLWSDVEELWDAPVQPELGSEWRTWKQEAMKLFFTSHPTSSEDMVQESCDNSVGLRTQVSRKRPKLEVRRPEMCDSEAEASCLKVHSHVNNVEIDSGYFKDEGLADFSLICDPHKVDATGIDASTNSGNVADRWDGTVVKGENLKSIQISEVGKSADGGSDRTPLIIVNHESDSLKKYRQCLAFIEAKGRQCGRWANDGDIYCCVHLSIRSVSKPSRLEQNSPFKASMCEGTTTHGQKCKHRARYGSAFCKKHRLQRSHNFMDADGISSSSGNKLKRKHDEDEDKMLEKICSTNTVSGNEIVLVGEIPTAVQENLIPVVVGETLDERNCLMKKSELYNALSTPVKFNTAELPYCIGYGHQNNDDQCLENAKKHTLYCEKHLPNFLKRARNGKSRLISKDIFINLLKNCSLRKQKIHLHRACELLYSFMKSSLSRQKSVSEGDHMGWILSEASKDENVGDFLLKLVSSEREKIGRLWGFDADKDKHIISSEMKPVPVFEAHEKDQGTQMTVKCKICAEEFSSDEKVSAHWLEIHKKEAQWLFRGYACAICMNAFTNRKVLEAHVKERHGMQFLEHSVLFRCMSCNSHFMNPEQLWKHVLSSHPMDFRLPMFTQQHNQSQSQVAQIKIELGSKSCPENGASEKEDGLQRFVCRFCGLKFDLLPDLGRHHQAAHMSSNSISPFPPKRANQHLKCSRYRHPRFKKGIGAAYRIKNSASFGMKKRFQASSSVIAARVMLQTQASETRGLGRLLESHCMDVAETLFTEIQQTKPRPNNLEILSIARSACCRTNLNETLHQKYGILPERLYLKAAKLCSELNIQVGWHLEEFACPKGCKLLIQPYSLEPLTPLSNRVVEPPVSTWDPANDGEWEIDECHYILSSRHFNWKPIRKTVVLCEDVSFGQESVPVACVVDEDIKDFLHINADEESRGQNLGICMPWQGFTYVTKRLLNPSLGLDTKNSQLGCACQLIKCQAAICDHVYLFDNDYENAKDIHGKSMRGRFPYDERGQIILEEGYLVYECNSMCSCDRTCQNRVLQNGVQVKLEVFRTEKKGWAVRAGEAISCGTFVCEYIGEVLNDVEANKRGERYDNEGCSYLYDIDAHIDDMGQLSEGTVPYVIDATKYGNVSRFINHSCSPNLVNYQVLVESMDCQLAHIGLYASRDIEMGEELAYDYRYKLLPGDGCPCYCGASKCRGRLY